MSKRIFIIEYNGSATIELDDQVIDVVNDEWRSQLYDLHTPEEIAEHIAYNFIFNSARLSDLDGWADQPDRNARLWENDVDRIEVEELLDVITDAG